MSDNRVGGLLAGLEQAWRAAPSKRATRASKRARRAPAARMAFCNTLCITETGMTTSVRMDAETEKLLKDLARERGSTKSEIVREAVRLAARRRPRSRIAERPYDAFRGVIGAVRGGPADLSERTGERFRKLLLDRKRKRS